jgi:hypothetical protein
MEEITAEYPHFQKRLEENSTTKAQREWIEKTTLILAAFVSWWFILLLAL